MSYKIQPQIYLASRSPRRRELLDQINVCYDVIRVDMDEAVLQGETPPGYVVRIARRKAWTGRGATGGLLPVLAADTAVVVGGEIFGKPRNRDQALAMLRILSGCTHQVLTGVALVGKEEAYALSHNAVTFRPISDTEALAYWGTGEPADKAGAYGIQGLGALFVERLEGSYSGVMGLPLFETARLLRQAGIDPLAATV